MQNKLYANDQFAVPLIFQAVHLCTPDAGVLVCDPPAVYRPRHPEATVFYQVFEQYFDKYVAEYEERFEPHSGPLRRVVPDSVEQFLACGRLQGGFARLRCPSCKSEHLIALACPSYYTYALPGLESAYREFDIAQETRTSRFRVSLLEVHWKTQQRSQII